VGLGGQADGWDAPFLDRPSHAPVPWTEDEIFAYLSTGFSPLHGVAAGPMAPVVASLQSVPADDIRAMAHYLASRLPVVSQQDAESRAATLEARAAAVPPDADRKGAALYEFACAVCHEPGRDFMFGIRPSLALNTNLYSARPDNLLRVILGGAGTSGAGRPGAMPAFRGSLDDRQLAQLLDYLRARFASDQSAWSGIETVAARIRAEARGF
jgi:nicotinate dehydrogenase subunit B